MHVNKIIKLSVLVIVLFLLSGCNVSYNLTFDEYMNVNETIIGTEYNSVMNNKNISVDYIVNTLDQIGELLQYTKQPINGTLTSGVNITQDFVNIDDYLSKSYLRSKVFNSININRKSDTIIIKATTRNTKQTTPDGTMAINGVNIKIPYQVINHNADTVDEQNNIYTWQLDDKPIRDINITYAAVANYQGNNNFLSNILSNKGVYVVIVILAIAIIIGMWLIVQNKKNNYL